MRSVAAGLVAITLALVPARSPAEAPAGPAATPVPAAASAAAPVEPGEPAPPTPDLTGLEPAVAAQLSAARDSVAALLAGPAGGAERAVAWGELGQLYHAYELLEPALACYLRAGALAPSDPRWPYLYAHAARAAGDLEAARRALLTALALGSYPAAQVTLSEIELASGRPQEAAAAARAALAAAPGEAAASAALGQALLAARDFLGAVTALEAALAAAPGADRLHYPLGLAYRGLGDEERARQHLGRAGRAGVRADDPILQALDAARRGELAPLLRGRRAAGAGDWAAAEREFRQALAANPASATAHVNLSAALAARGDRAGAAAELSAALASEPANATAHFNLGVLLLGGGDLAGALPHLAAAAAARPNDAEARRTLGETLLNLDRTEEALPHLAAAILAAPGDEAARLDEAAALLRLARTGEARARLEEGVRQLPTAGRLVHVLARLLAAAPVLELRDGPRAVDLAASVWAAQPAPEHGRTLALALAEAGRCDEAARLAARLATEAPPELAERLRRDSAHFAAGPPCRPLVETP